MLNCALDLGNTQLKAALFNSKEFAEIGVFQTMNDLVAFVQEKSPEHCILSSVLADHETNFLLSQLKEPILILNEETKLPFANKYGTPDSLGKDRLANAAFLGGNSDLGNALVIDAGTCLKFDLVTQQKEYLGGSIGPGLEMRFKALNNYTGKLPLISFEEDYQSLVGDSTKSSIMSGVKIGMQEEINGLIARYEQEFPDLTIFITGGDLDKFELKSKNTIFADRLITLKGLNEILLYNL